MKRRLIVMRHGEAERGSAGGDHKRKLTEYGRRQAHFVGKGIDERGWRPSLCIYSDAMRTVETREELESAWGDGVEWQEAPGFYLGGLSELSEVLGRIGDEVMCVHVLGHNPGWSEVVGNLCGLSVSLSTADAGLLEVEAESWSSGLLMGGCWDLEEVLRGGAVR